MQMQWQAFLCGGHNQLSALGKRIALRWPYSALFPPNEAISKIAFLRCSIANVPKMWSPATNKVSTQGDTVTNEQKINSGHEATRNFLRVSGPLVLAVGGIFMVIGLVSFFSAFGGGGPPRLFWCCFVGMPLLAVGTAITKFGFMGAIVRYQAGEVAPVGRDTFNYMAEGTKDGVRTVATAAASGLRDTSNQAQLRCSSCGHSNDANAKFCDECGAALSKLCPSCAKRNDGDAKFCSGCGSLLEAGA